MLSKTIKQLPTLYSYIMFNRRIEIYISEDTYQYEIFSYGDGADNYYCLYRFLYRHNREFITNKDGLMVNPDLFDSGDQMVYTDHDITINQEVNNCIYILKNMDDMGGGVRMIPIPIIDLFKNLDTDNPIYTHNKISITMVNPIVIMKYSTYVI